MFSARRSWPVAGTTRPTRPAFTFTLTSPSGPMPALASSATTVTHRSFTPREPAPPALHATLASLTAAPRGGEPWPATATGGPATTAAAPPHTQGGDVQYKLKPKTETKQVKKPKPKKTKNRNQKSKKPLVFS